MKNTLSIVLFLFSILITGSCSNSNTSKPVSQQAENFEENTLQDEELYLKMGSDVVMAAKSNLAKYLLTALSEQGPEGALEFCNIKAIPITDSLSVELSANIKRVSDKPRNPSNQASDKELLLIEKLKLEKERAGVPAPTVIDAGETVIGYYPIITNQMCLQCHGKPGENIKTSTLAKINELYPNDMAVGYNIDEIRGLFVVEMNKK